MDGSPFGPWKAWSEIACSAWKAYSPFTSSSNAAGAPSFVICREAKGRVSNCKITRVSACLGRLGSWREGDNMVVEWGRRRPSIPESSGHDGRLPRRGGDRHGPTSDPRGRYSERELSLLRRRGGLRRWPAFSSAPPPWQSEGVVPPARCSHSVSTASPAPSHGEVASKCCVEGCWELNRARVRRRDEEKSGAGAPLVVANRSRWR